MEHRSIRSRSSLRAAPWVVLLLAACSASPPPATTDTDKSAVPDTATATTTTATPEPGASPTAAPAPPETPVTQLLKLLDRDDDGRVSRAEHADEASKMFNRMDTDHNGRVTVDEMDAVRRGLHGDDRSATAAAVEKVDLDHDGELALDEHTTATRFVFERMDTDHDYFLTEAELGAANASGGAPAAR